MIMKYPSPRFASLAIIVACCLILHVGSARAGDKDKDDDPGPDPYTKMKPEAMKDLGYVTFGPFSLTETHTTEAVEALIGAKWMLWVETEHFKIGSTLGTRPIVSRDPDASKRLKAELNRFKKKHPRIKKKFKELDEWLTLHLYAQRLEELYSDVSARFAVDAEDAEQGESKADDSATDSYVGWKYKFIVLLFEQKGNLARYLGRYVGVNRDKAYRHLFSEANCMLYATSREDFASWPDEDTAFFSHVTANMVHNLITTYGGYRYKIPLWWEEGLTHWYVRNIDPQFFFPTTVKDQKRDFRRDHEWEKKVYGRIKNNYFRPTKELVAILDPKEMDFADHMMAWSRVDYLLTLGSRKTGKFMEIMKGLSWEAGNKQGDLLAVQEKALREAWNLDPDTLDKQWTAWVLKKYKNPPKRRR